MNRVFNHAFSQTLSPLLISGALIALILLFGSVVKSFHRLPFSGIMNCVLGCVFLLIAIRYILEGGGKLRDDSKYVKRVLLQKFLHANSYCGVVGIKLRKLNRTLNTCMDLRMDILNNEFATNNSFPEFVNMALIQSVNYVLAF